ncbi:MAG: CDP-alcohol phosphatidyltransferase family protein, partial [Candidatus Rokuibacteriota bacterium]
AVRWLTPDTPAPVETPSPWLLLPASSLIHVSALTGLLGRPAPRGAVLVPSVPGAPPAALAPAPLVAALWKDLAAGEPVGASLARQLAEARAEPRDATGPYVAVSTASDLARAEEALQATLGITADSVVDHHLHRRFSRGITRLLVRTPVTPNLVSLSSLAIGLASIWCFWHATPAGAFLGLLLYTLASIVDHSDGETARLTFQESRFGANLDWTIDTIIQAGIVLGIGVSAGGAFMEAVGAVATAGIILSAILARGLSRETEVGPAGGGVLEHIAKRDLFYLVLLSFAVLRWLAPSLVFLVAVVVAVGSNAYWVGCLARIRRTRRAQTTFGRPD